MNKLPYELAKEILGLDPEDQLSPRIALHLNLIQDRYRAVGGGPHMSRQIVALVCYLCEIGKL